MDSFSIKLYMIVCILKSFIISHFYKKNYKGTAGIDFRHIIIQLNDINVKLELWDSAG
jgi:hypothetical protein